jgi:NADPH:quinone reductase-like Zn-dependent oxidoreductase
MAFTGKQLTSTLAADGTLTNAIAETTFADPTGRQVLVRMAAAPINPSDLGLLFASADVDSAQFSPGKVVAQMPEAMTRASAARHGMAMPAGNEGSGTVVAAGEDPAAQALMGKRVACVPGAAYATYALCDAGLCMPLPDDVTFEQAASSFVNPMTALGFVETMRAGGFKGIVHAAAASNLGQMLVRICAEDRVPLVNIVRTQAQVDLLKGLGASHVLNMAEDGFMASLIAAIEETGAMIGFDPIGGGTLAGQMLTAMNAAASKGQAFSRYGSMAAKKVCIYGALDTGPTILNRSFGLTWDLSGWLLFPFLTQAGAETGARMRQRVMSSLHTTFASNYKAHVALDDMLGADAVRDYNARRTGEKYLVVM